MGKFGSLATSDEPLRVYLIDPVTDDMIRDEDGKASYIDVLPSDGDRGRAWDKAQRKAAVSGADAETPFEQNASKCAHLTTGWYLVDPNTSQPIDITCTPANAREFYMLPQTNWFVQVWVKAIGIGNFMKRSAKSSTYSQSGNSATAAAPATVQPS